MRNIFIEELILATKKNKNIFLVVNDLGYNVIESFKNKFPKNVINAGVSEQSMMGYAAGLAASGKQVFVYSIGNFNTFGPRSFIAGNVSIGNYNFFALNSSVLAGITIGDKVRLLVSSTLFKNPKDNQNYYGSPATKFLTLS